LDAARVEFFNLARAGLSPAQGAARLAALHYGRGRRVWIHARDQRQVEELDQALWTYDPASFLPHAPAGGPDQDQEPVVIAAEPAGPGPERVLILTHHQDQPPLERHRHIILLLPERECPELAAMRELYRRLKDQEGVEVIHAASLA
jgi:DNA polymerase-3 subunit chi